MCYSFKTSVTSYLVGLVAAIFALCTRQIMLGLFILAFVQVQLAEAMIWYGIENNSIRWNKIGTALIKYTLPSHNLFLGLGVIISIALVSRSRLKAIDFLPVAIGLILYMVVVIGLYNRKSVPPVYTTFPRKTNCLLRSQQPRAKGEPDGEKPRAESKNANAAVSRCEGTENRLEWKFPHTYYIVSFVITVAILLFWAKPFKTGLSVVIVLTAACVIAAVVMPHVQPTMWCLSAAVLAPVLVVCNYLMIRGTPSSEIV